MTRYEKSVSNIKEVKARDGIVISVVTEGDHLAREASDHVVVFRPRWSYSAAARDPFPCSCSPIISPCAAGAMLTSRAISQNP